MDEVIAGWAATAAEDAASSLAAKHKGDESGAELALSWLAQDVSQLREAAQRLDIARPGL